MKNVTIFVLFAIFFVSCGEKIHSYHSSYMKFDEENSALIFDCKTGLIDINPKKIKKSAGNNRCFIPLLIEGDSGFENTYPDLILEVMDTFELKIMSLDFKIDEWWHEGSGSDLKGIWIILSPAPLATLLYSEEAVDTVTLKKGDSLYKTFGMTNEQALEFAVKNNRKHWEENGKWYVLVYEGEMIVREWRPVN